MMSANTRSAEAIRPIVVGQRPLTVDEVVLVARHRAPVEIGGHARERMLQGREAVDVLAKGQTPAYGVSTGFGALADRKIDVDARARLQVSLVRSHAAGTGAEVEEETIRALMLLRLQTLTSGHTGVRPDVAERYTVLLNEVLTPVVYENGSLGCSGDLAPLAHCALAVIGEGEVRDREGALRDSAEALVAVGSSPVELQAKEGLALINGTDGMLGMLALSIDDLRLLARTADVSAAMSVEALLGTDRVFDAALQAVRPHPGQRASARNLVLLLAESGIVASHRGADCTVVQDAYSLRCAPQVAGAFRATLSHAEDVASIELASAVDNPVVLDDGRVESNGNFHGAPVGYVCDFLAVAAADLASISERRTDRLLDPARSHGLPAFVAADPGIDSGLMIAQYTQASLVSDLKRLAAPASVDSIPSSAMQEDHVSMGWAAARKLRRTVDALTRVLAIELMAAARGLELRAPLPPSPATRAALDQIREHVDGVGPDRMLAPDITAMVELVRSGAVTRAVGTVTGPLA